MRLPPKAFRSFVLVLGVGLFGSACASVPEVPANADPALEVGRDVWGARCATCHGPSGGGGTGSVLNDGLAVERYPDIADEIAVVRDGRANMPSFASVLSEEEIEAVVRYTREVL
ncbi:MAG: cytochrome c [Acidimicrobiales bacterium]